MIELQLFQRRERTVSFLGKLEAATLEGVGSRE
jgi:hypothetical protein